MEQYLKEIAKELKLIRREMKRENDLYERDINEMNGVSTEHKPAPKISQSVADSLNRMFGNGT